MTKVEFPFEGPNGEPLVETMFRLDFSFETPHGVFNDALWFSDAQPIPSDSEIEDMKQRRLANWLASLVQRV